jgi:hypothetical protein
MKPRKITPTQLRVIEDLFDSCLRNGFPVNKTMFLAIRFSGVTFATQLTEPQASMVINELKYLTAYKPTITPGDFPA